MRVVLAIILLALIAAVPVGAEEDVAQAVQWNWHLVPENATPGSEAELVVLADLAPHWVVYSSDFKAEIGPLPARLKRAPKSQLELLDSLRSIGAKRKQDPDLDVEYGYFSERLELRQRVRLPQDGAPLEAVLSAQACFETDGTCHLIRQNITIAAR
jgi:hypothetical protein